MLGKTLLVSVYTATLVLAGCGGTNPVLKAQDSEIHVNQGKVSITAVRNAIIRAGQQKGWRMRIVSNSKILATMRREGYMAKTEIKYSPRSYTIKYKDSSNMKYDGDNIHSYYNEWVEQLDDEIKSQLQNS